MNCINQRAVRLTFHVAATKQHWRLKKSSVHRKLLTLTKNRRKIHAMRLSGPKEMCSCWFLWCSCLTQPNALSAVCMTRRRIEKKQFDQKNGTYVCVFWVPNPNWGLRTTFRSYVALGCVYAQIRMNAAARNCRKTNEQKKTEWKPVRKRNEEKIRWRWCEPYGYNGHDHDAMGMWVNVLSSNAICDYGLCIFLGWKVSVVPHLYTHRIHTYRVLLCLIPLRALMPIGKCR